MDAYGKGSRYEAVDREKIVWMIGLSKGHFNDAPAELLDKMYAE